MPPKRRRPAPEKAAARAILTHFRRLQAELGMLTTRFERYEHQCDTNMRRCAEMQAEIDALRKHTGHK